MWRCIVWTCRDRQHNELSEMVRVCVRGCVEYSWCCTSALICALPCLPTRQHHHLEILMFREYFHLSDLTHSSTVTRTRCQMLFQSAGCCSLRVEGYFELLHVSLFFRHTHRAVLGSLHVSPSTSNVLSANMNGRMRKFVCKF